MHRPSSRRCLCCIAFQPVTRYTHTQRIDVLCGESSHVFSTLWSSDESKFRNILIDEAVRLVHAAVCPFFEWIPVVSALERFFTIVPGCRCSLPIDSQGHCQRYFICVIAKRGLCNHLVYVYLVRFWTHWHWLHAFDDVIVWIPVFTQRLDSCVPF